MRKIVFFITGLEIGGAENQLVQICNNLDKKKYKITVVCLSDKTLTSTQLESNRIHVLTLNLKYSKIRGIFKLYNFLKSYKADVFIGFLFHGIMMARIFSFIFSPSITISSIRSINLGGNCRKLLLKFTDFLSDYTVVNSELVKSEIIRLKISKLDKVRVIHNIIDLKRFSIDTESCKSLKNEFKINNDTFIWLAVGRLVEAKDYFSMIYSFKEYLKYDNNCCLIIIGDGNLKSDLTNLISALKLQDKIFMLGKKYNIADFLSISDAFLLTSKWEGLPNCVLEALMMKLPVVATNVGGVSEIVIHNENGFLVEKENINSISTGMINMRKNYNKFINNKSYNKLIEVYNLKTIICNWDNLIKK